MLIGLHFRLACILRAHRCLYLLLTAMILTALIMSSGCSSDTNGTSYTGPTSYTSYALCEGDAHFSFEYPINYEEVVTYVYPGWAAVDFDRSLVEEGWIIKRSYFRVDVYEAGRRDNPDAEAALEATIARFADDEYYSDFKILDRSSVTIAGVEGEQVEFSYYYPEMRPSVDDEGPFLKLPATFVVRCAYFDYSGFIWEIFLQSTEGVADEDKVHFEHIVETFTILD